ncbi:hypothetical protein GCM10027174_26680 [Salinifilum aidingensis]
MVDESGARTCRGTATGGSPPAGRGRCGLLLAAGLLYAAWLAGPWVNPGMDVVDGYVSELAARDQPGSAFFRTGDVLAGLCATAAAVGGLRRRPGRRAVTGWAGVAVFGLATTTDAAFTPMDCAPFVDAACAVRELAGTLSLSHELHALTSSLAGAAALAGMAAFALAAAREGGPGPPPRWAWTWLAVTAAATVLTLAALVLGTGAGVLQRVQLAGISTWLVALAVCEGGGETCSTS